MNLGSEQKLSMDELLERNRPAQMVHTTPPEVHPTKLEWEDLQSYLYTLGYHAERQTGNLKKINELLLQLPTRTQMDELLKAVKHLEQMGEQAGKRNEKRFSLPGIRLPRLRLPHLDGPTWTVLLMGTAALLLAWIPSGAISVYCSRDGRHHHAPVHRQENAPQAAAKENRPGPRRGRS